MAHPIRYIRLQTPPPPDGSEDLRLKTKKLLYAAALSLQHAHDAAPGDDATIGESVETSVTTLIAQFRDILLKIYDPYLPKNNIGAQIGLDILQKLCSTHFSDWRFTEIFVEISLGIQHMSNETFWHNEPQRLQMRTDLDSVFQTLLPLKATILSGERAYSFASVIPSLPLLGLLAGCFVMQMTGIRSFKAN
jgi:hypothetical protein